MKVQAVASNPIVQEETELSFTLKPTHSIFAKDAPELTIEFPPEVQIRSIQCLVKKVKLNGTSVSSEAKCTRDQ